MRNISECDDDLSFLEEVLDQRAVHRVQQNFSVQIDWSTLFKLMPVADLNGKIRIINPEKPIKGHNKADVAKRLNIAADWTGETWREVFKTGHYSFAIESFEQFHPAIQKISESLRELTSCRVIATAFLSPAWHKGTVTHYDKWDVLVLQVHGKKRWRIFNPVDADPSSRTPNVLLPPESELIFSGDHTLSPSEALFVPCGWIHDVRNESEEPSLHISFVIFSDTLLSVFGNAITHAYSRMTTDGRWRSTLNRTPISSSAIQDMLLAFNEYAYDILTRNAEHFYDHVRNDVALRIARADAIASFDAVIAGHDYDVSLKWVYGHHRNVLRNGVMEVSTDGSNTCGLDPVLYELCRNKNLISFSELKNFSSSTDEHIKNFIITAVHRLGLLKAIRC